MRAQELVEVVGRSAGVVIMAPPDDSAEAQAALATLLSSLKPKQKACPCTMFCSGIFQLTRMVRNMQYRCTGAVIINDNCRTCWPM